MRSQTEELSERLSEDQDGVLPEGFTLASFERKSILLNTPVWRLRYLLFTAALAAFFVIVMGNVVRVTGASQACPDWPTCFGQYGLPQSLLARYQVIHRALSAFLAFAAVAAAVVVAWKYRRVNSISRPAYAAAAIVAVQVILGASITLGSSPLLSTVHLALALIVLGLLLASTVSSFYFEYAQQEKNGSINFSGFKDRLVFRTPFARLTLATCIALLVLLLTGTFVVNLGVTGACQGWPLCSGGIPVNGGAWIEMGHRLVTLTTGILMAVLIWRAWRSQRSQRVQLTTATAVFILFAGQVLVGALKVVKGFPADLMWLHAASAAALWGAMTVLTVSVGLADRQPESEALEALEPLQLKARLKDFLVLSKPVIVALLLVTTYAGMVMGGRAIPSLSLTFWTMLGGALAAGGASALNQYIDRDTDKAMQRTAKRPLPAGRLQPAEGLAFGTGTVLLSFFLLAGFVNLLAALLSLAGMVYYVLLYSMWLKRLTVQNIVIGGGAGAIPPLVGWAAASGSLNIPSLFLFAIVFMWTPPHFWALALVRRKDYARASIPMLPVVKGEKATRIQIFVYTLELVGLTLLMPLFKVAGSFFLVSAVVLGLWLVYAAWKVLKKGGNKTAWKMYRYSSMYLAFLFLALVLDVFIKL
jgi:heme o synthase